MDEFVRNKLSEWGLSNWIERFQDHEINEVNFCKLDNEEIKELIPKVGPRKIFMQQLALLKVLPSTSGANDTRNLNMDPQEDSSQCQSPSAKRKRRNSAAEEQVMCEVKDIMKGVEIKLQETTELNFFLKKRICDLETSKREVVGVFGKTGAGKSTLINAIIGEKNLLPSGDVSACTSVMLKVEANNHSKKYEAEIEFMTKEDWKDEVWFYKHFGDDDEDREKLTAVYGDQPKSKSVEELMDNRLFREIPEFLTSTKKTFTCDSAIELRDRIVRYTRASTEEGDGGGQYWPLVECVTVRLPDNDLLQHVTLVDLPGNGDRCKSRDKMWKKIVGSCSTVWIVADIVRAAAETEAWEILDNASCLMGNSGECQRIHFICTKSDIINDSDAPSENDVRGLVLTRNQKAKDMLATAFRKKDALKKQFGDDCLKVFTVSSKEFDKSKYLQPDDTEIPQLQDFLQSLNNHHSETVNYVSGAHGILSLIQGARFREVAECKRLVSGILKNKIHEELTELKKQMNQIYRTFEQCLTEGVEESQRSCEKELKSLLNPRGESGRGLYNKLHFAVLSNGLFKAKKGKQKNINMTLSSKLTASIDEEFRKTFPNEDKSRPFKGAIDSFSLDTEELIETHADVKLQLHFLKTEEDKLKRELNQIIKERKKTVYSRLTETIEENMQKCYKDAARANGQGALEKLRSIITAHVRDEKATMFQRAKVNMLEKLRDLSGEILEKLKRTLVESIELSLEVDDNSLPDVSRELHLVEGYKRRLEENPNPN